MKFIAVVFSALLGIFLLDSCQAPSIQAKTPKVQQDTLIDFIKARSLPREQFPNMLKTHWERQPAISLETVRRIQARALNANDTIPLDSFAVYHAFDHNDLEDRFLFSIAYSDENGFTYLYHFTLDKASNVLTGCTLIGESGVDGGTESNSKLSYAKDGLSLIVNAKSTYENVGEYPHELLTDKSSTRYDFLLDKTAYRLLHEAHDKSVIEKKEE